MRSKYPIRDVFQESLDSFLQNNHIASRNLGR